MSGRKKVWWFDANGSPQVRWQEIIDIEDPVFDAVVRRNEPSPDPPVALWRCMGGLTKKQRFVIDLRYGLGGHGEHTQEQVAAFMGITQQAVDRIEQRSLARLGRLYKESLVREGTDLENDWHTQGWDDSGGWNDREDDSGDDKPNWNDVLSLDEDV